jgi:uncharacterized membrane protein
MTKPHRSIRTNILVGLLLMTPIVVTAFVINWLFRFITNRVLVFLPKHLREGDQEILWRIAALLIVIVILYLAGLLLRNILGKRLYHLGDRLLARTPVINRIYVGTRQVIEALFQQRQTLFQEVVLLEYPRPGVYSMGFVTAIVPPSYTAQLNEQIRGEECLSIFIPTTPNPTSGWFCIVPRSSVIKLNMSTGEAMKLIVSGGAVFPGEVSSKTPTSLLDMLHDWSDKEETAPPNPLP